MKTLAPLFILAVVHQALCFRMTSQRFVKKVCFMGYDPIFSPNYFKRLETLDSKASASSADYDNELLALKEIDISRNDIYFDATKPLRDGRASIAMKENNMQFVADTEDAFSAIQEGGFSRRLSSERANIVGESLFSSSQNIASRMTSDLFELRKSKEQQLVDLKNQRIKQRLGIEKLLPRQITKYLDYFRSLRVEPNPSDQRRSLAVAAFFTFIVQVLPLRSTYMFVAIGILMSASQLLSRGMPQNEWVPGQPKRQLGTWSKNSFLSSVGITLYYAALSFFGTLGLLTLTGMDFTIRMKISFGAALMSTAFFTSSYEVFEPKGKNGWRWKKAMNGGTLSAEEEAQLAKEVYGKKILKGSFSYAYNPQVDDYPRQPKYMDELEGAKPISNPAGGDLDEGESKEHFDTWYRVRKDSRRAPITEATSGEPWIGSKADLFLKNFPAWIEKAYMRNVLKANKWRNKPAKDFKDYSEFEPIPGPWTFRDKRVDWLNIIGLSPYEEKLQASRKAARAFGTYRKSMWKIDKEVKLLPSDGGDKKKPEVEKKSSGDEDPKKPKK